MAVVLTSANVAEARWRKVVRVEWRSGTTLLGRWFTSQQAGMLCLQERGMPVLWVKGPVEVFLAALDQHFPPSLNLPKGDVTVTFAAEPGEGPQSAVALCCWGPQAARDLCRRVSPPLEGRWQTPDGPIVSNWRLVP